ncbi:helix-turn-helix domain-containing protein [Yunchengibacter salinarum]|uniref:helix-turn-helix domain-containing protein n=1 Tax=Yunchengibacter salinarum TaxID=3133399 RepID=UPI0035B66325
MSKALENMHSTARDLHAVGAMDAVTMKVMDDLCLPEKRTFTQADIRKIRDKTRMSQPVFAAFLGVTVSAIAQWERGVKTPGGSAQRLLDVIDRKGIEALL